MRRAVFFMALPVMVSSLLYLDGIDVDGEALPDWEPVPVVEVAEVEEEPEEVEPAIEKEQLDQDDLDLLAALVMAEAESQDFMGKRLVARVVFNRVEDSEFPDDIESVVFEPRAFTPTEDGRLEEVSGKVTNDCYEAVQAEFDVCSDPNIKYFCSGGFSQYGEPLYRYQDHYFSK